MANSMNSKTHFKETKEEKMKPLLPHEFDEKQDLISTIGKMAKGNILPLKKLGDGRFKILNQNMKVDLKKLYCTPTEKLILVMYWLF